MQILIWVIIIIVAIFLIRLLRRWIKRLIFIAILLVLAFFIYWIFNPSWAGKLWYNIRTLPQRITSKISNQNFINYEEYKSNLSEIWDKIKLNTNGDEPNKISNNKEDTELQNNNENDNNKKNGTTTDESKHSDNENTLQTFPEMIKFSNLINFVENDNNNVNTWYKKSDLLWIINSYIQNHLNDNTDILVTIEYEDDYNDPQKIILQTEHNTDNTDSYIPEIWIIETWNEWNIQTQRTKENTYKTEEKWNKLNQEDIKETEDIFSILF